MSSASEWTMNKSIKITKETIEAARSGGIMIHDTKHPLGGYIGYRLNEGSDLSLTSKVLTFSSVGGCRMNDVGFHNPAIDSTLLVLPPELRVNCLNFVWQFSCHFVLDTTTTSPSAGTASDFVDEVALCEDEHFFALSCFILDDLRKISRRLAFANQDLLLSTPRPPPLELPNLLGLASMLYIRFRDWPSFAPFLLVRRFSVSAVGDAIEPGYAANLFFRRLLPVTHEIDTVLAPVIPHFRNPGFGRAGLELFDYTPHSEEKKSTNLSSTTGRSSSTQLRLPRLPGFRRGGAEALVHLRALDLKIRRGQLEWNLGFLKRSIHCRFVKTLYVRPFRPFSSSHPRNQPKNSRERYEFDLLQLARVFPELRSFQLHGCDKDADVVHLGEALCIWGCLKILKISFANSLKSEEEKRVDFSGCWQRLIGKQSDSASPLQEVSLMGVKDFGDLDWERLSIRSSASLETVRLTGSSVTPEGLLSTLRNFVLLKKIEVSVSQISRDTSAAMSFSIPTVRSLKIVGRKGGDCVNRRAVNLGYIPLVFPQLEHLSGAIRNVAEVLTSSHADLLKIRSLDVVVSLYIDPDDTIVDFRKGRFYIGEEDEVLYLQEYRFLELCGTPSVEAIALSFGMGGWGGLFEIVWAMRDSFPVPFVHFSGLRKIEGLWGSTTTTFIEVMKRCPWLEVIVGGLGDGLGNVPSPESVQSLVDAFATSSLRELGLVVGHLGDSFRMNKSDTDWRVIASRVVDLVRKIYRPFPKAEELS